MAGPGGRCCPSRPTEEGRQFADVFRILNGLWPQSELRRGFSEERSIVCLALVESARLRIGVNERACGSVVTICLEIVDRSPVRGIRISSSIEFNTRKRRAMQIFRR